MMFFTYVLCVKSPGNLGQSLDLMERYMLSSLKKDAAR